ncbi:hypothetical protein BCR32DRAFT_250430 [Anaeromyces robustus]|uniref:Uncharacterized protein n=1 Tax=Anaeromyces robustus TaxID=1754192 RepID=A0A1Y1W1I6_9FUNG|nr:hypothetical protein BCR32DRAFT_250430 [Anaeromyces robustus]|eukprot:ORX67371.1 hypothetical protein BCR32DRAFT_250430 [Anaeromyces robustus]
MTYSTIDEPIALTGKVYRKTSLLKIKPYLFLCLPISVDDCAYIYNKISNRRNTLNDPYAPLFIGHLAIASINAEAILIVLSSKVDLDNPTFIHFKKTGRKLRFCNILFNKDVDKKLSYKDSDMTLKLTTDNEKDKTFNTTDSNITNSLIDIEHEIIRISEQSNDDDDDDEITDEIPSHSEIPKPIIPQNKISDDIFNESFNYNYQCCEKYIENYNKEKEMEKEKEKEKEKENELKLKTSQNSLLKQDSQQDDLTILNDTLLLNDKDFNFKSKNQSNPNLSFIPTTISRKQQQQQLNNNNNNNNNNQKNKLDNIILSSDNEGLLIENNDNKPIDSIFSIHPTLDEIIYETNLLMQGNPLPMSMPMSMQMPIFSCSITITNDSYAFTSTTI